MKKGFKVFLVTLLLLIFAGSVLGEGESTGRIVVTDGGVNTTIEQGSVELELGTFDYRNDKEYEDQSAIYIDSADSKVEVTVEENVSVATQESVTNDGYGVYIDDNDGRGSLDAEVLIGGDIQINVDGKGEAVSLHADNQESSTEVKVEGSIILNTSDEADSASLRGVFNETEGESTVTIGGDIIINNQSDQGDAYGAYLESKDVELSVDGKIDVRFETEKDRDSNNTEAVGIYLSLDDHRLQDISREVSVGDEIEIVSSSGYQAFAAGIKSENKIFEYQEIEDRENPILSQTVTVNGDVTVKAAYTGELSEEEWNSREYGYQAEAYGVYVRPTEGVENTNITINGNISVESDADLARANAIYVGTSRNYNGDTDADIDVMVNGNVKSDGEGIYFNLFEGKTTVAIFGDETEGNLTSEGVGILIGDGDPEKFSKARNKIPEPVIEAVISGELTSEDVGVLIEETNVVTNNITVAVWAVADNEDGNIVETVDDDGNRTADTKFEQENLYYIIRVTQPEQGELISLDNTKKFLDGRYEAARESERVILKVDVPAGYELAGAIDTNYFAGNVQLQKGADGNYYIDVPRNGGVNLSIVLKPTGEEEKKEDEKSEDKETKSEGSSSSSEDESPRVLVTVVSEIPTTGTISKQFVKKDGNSVTWRVDFSDDVNITNGSEFYDFVGWEAKDGTTGKLGDGSTDHTIDLSNLGLTIYCTNETEGSMILLLAGKDYRVESRKFTTVSAIGNVPRCVEGFKIVFLKNQTGSLTLRYTTQAESSRDETLVNRFYFLKDGRLLLNGEATKAIVAEEK